MRPLLLSVLAERQAQLRGVEPKRCVRCGEALMSDEDFTDGMCIMCHDEYGEYDKKNN